MTVISPYQSRQQRCGRRALIAFGSLVFAFLILPTLAIIPLSLNPSGFLVFQTEGVSIRWYQALWASPDWARAFRNSVMVGVATMLMATPLGTLAAIGLARLQSGWKPVVIGLIATPMVVPVVVVAITFYFLFAPLGLANSFVGLVAAHTVLAVPFVVIVVLATLLGFDF